MDFSTSSPMDLSTRAQALVASLAKANGDVGYMSCAVYDTAWVAMVAKPTADGEQWLFPQCFQYVLDTQQADGAWPTYAADVDGILNTTASLLAIKKHLDTPLQLTTPSAEELSERLTRGQAALQILLDGWDVDATTHVGFEFLVPTLLQLLADQDMAFDFPGRTALMAQNKAKLSKFRVEFLYSKHKTTAIHSLEAFLPTLDYNKVRHHKDFGAMMASPSSTAAYLMKSTPWDHEAEAYLHDVLQLGAGRGSGGIPSAFPSTYFEVTWMLTTLLKNEYTAGELGFGESQQLAELLSKALHNQGGLLGFAPSVQPDVDDTAKTLTTLSVLGHPASPQGMLERFEQETHFKTYDGERNPSFSANCNVLVALLSQQDPSIYQNQITKIVRFLVDIWWNADGWIEDKWNLSQHYSTMLMADAFSAVIKLWDAGELPLLPEQLVRDGLVISLFQALVRTLQTQNEDGSWGTRGSKEETSYAVLTIAKASVLPVAEGLLPVITKALEAGKNFIATSQETAPAYLWIEKVSYGSEALSESYTLAALKSNIPEKSSLSTKTRDLVSIPEKNVKQFTKFYSMIPLFSKSPAWRLQAALIEGYLFLPSLKEMRLDIFPRSGMEDDRYFEYIPFTWTSNNNLENSFISSKALNDMMVVSFLNYQADEFMEAVVGRYFGDRSKDVLNVIDHIFASLDQQKQDSDVEFSDAAEDDHAPAGPTDPLTPPSDVSSDQEDSADNMVAKSKPSLGDVRNVLQRFITHVMNHSAVTSASPLLQASVRNELRIFLLAHMDQASDNDRFATQSNIATIGAAFETPRSSFYRWVQSTSSDHTSCPYSFMLYQCILTEELSNKGEIFPSVEEKYIAEAMCRHLAVLCRMYNDYGSIHRDKDEKNLNSINFPDFHSSTPSSSPSSPPSSSTTNENLLKARLWTLAEYERENVERAFEKLRVLAGNDKEGERTLQKMRVFVNVTDLYGQIYVARDIASRM
ncbi:Hypothetical protein R9X50_00768900 [Acrodontium crateriforme]|uniref:Ent-kaurene synthase n=1 Tax=Acrodontium crateriforme TaxID=150365 RepID=A0AAQ3MCM6_9PEZI|nr:Hypothetical protein R9X50_00768900 [Acrodontium crateriforme]